MKELILEEEEAIYQNRVNKEKFNKIVLIITIILLVYWIVLLYTYEKEKISESHDEGREC